MWSAFKKHLRRVLQQWDDWVGDREMEVAIRQHLFTRGFRRSSAKLSRVRLAFVKRPGWQQIYQFDAEVQYRDELIQQGQPSERISLFGLVRLDTRSQKQPHVESFQLTSDRIETLQTWKLL